MKTAPSRPPRPRGERTRRPQEWYGAAKYDILYGPGTGGEKAARWGLSGPMVSFIKHGRYWADVEPVAGDGPLA